MIILYGVFLCCKLSLCACLQYYMVSRIPFPPFVWSEPAWAGNTTCAKGNDGVSRCIQLPPFPSEVPEYGEKKTPLVCPASLSFVPSLSSQMIHCQLLKNSKKKLHSQAYSLERSPHVSRNV